MSIAQALLPEFDHETANTRRVLERLPDDKFDWKCHPKSHTIGWVASHLAEILGWVEGTFSQDSWDLDPPFGEKYTSPKLANRAETLELFDQNLAAARPALAAATDEAFQQPWSLLVAGKTMFTMPRIAVVRGFVINHLIHHRAILLVYYRLNDVPVPSMYGPQGDAE